MVMETRQKAQALEFIISECSTHLSLDDEVYNYLHGTRKLTDAIIKKFSLGAFPSNIKRIATTLGPEVLSELKVAWISSGLCKFRDHYRVIAPIYDAFRTPVAITGRFLGTESERKELKLHKYDNSDYNKSYTLFGLNYAKSAIKQQDKVLVVEGILDVVTAHMHGIENVVATGGAFIRAEHLAQLARYTGNIYLSFDNDDAGDIAVQNAIKLGSRYTALNLIEKRVPKQYKDIDEYLTTKGESK